MSSATLRLNSSTTTDSPNEIPSMESPETAHKGPQTINETETSTVLKNLHHFTAYEIKVRREDR